MLYVLPTLSLMIGQKLVGVLLKTLRQTLTQTLTHSESTYEKLQTEQTTADTKLIRNYFETTIVVTCFSSVYIVMLRFHFTMAGL